MKGQKNLTFVELFFKILSKWKLFFSFIFLIFLFCMIILSVFILFTEYSTNKIDLVQVEESGAVIVNLKNNKRTATFLLSPNGTGNRSPWINTGIKIKHGEKASFSVSGKVCTGFHRMVEAAVFDSLPPLPWNGPEGIGKEEFVPPIKIRKEESKRKKLLIVPNDNYPQGRLIGIITSGQFPPNKPNQIEIIDITNYNSRNTAYQNNGNTGVLWLTINEVWLDKDLMSNLEPQDLDISKNVYDYIISNEYWNIWFDDNAGFFSVSVEIQ